MRKSKKIKVDNNQEVVMLKNQLARALADYDNLEKRIEKQKKLLENTLTVRLIVKMLSVLDMLEEVQGHVDDPGLAISINEFKRVLEDEGVRKIETKEEDVFDENIHDAVEKVKTKKEDLDGRVAEIVASGWIKNEDLVVRPTMVKVYGK